MQCPICGESLDDWLYLEHLMVVHEDTEMGQRVLQWFYFVIHRAVRDTNGDGGTER